MRGVAEQMMGVPPGPQGRNLSLMGNLKSKNRKRGRNRKGLQGKRAWRGQPNGHGWHAPILFGGRWKHSRPFSWTPIDTRGHLGKEDRSGSGSRWEPGSTVHVSGPDQRGPTPGCLEGSPYLSRRQSESWAQGWRPV